MRSVSTLMDYEPNASMHATVAEEQTIGRSEAKKKKRGTARGPATYEARAGTVKIAGNGTAANLARRMSANANAGKTKVEPVLEVGREKNAQS